MRHLICHFQLNISAWSEKSKEDEEGEEEKKTFKTSYDIIVDYSEYSTIQVKLSNMKVLKRNRIAQRRR